MTPADSRYLRNASFFCSVACGGYAREGSEGQYRPFGTNETARNREPEDAARERAANARNLRRNAASKTRRAPRPAFPDVDRPTFGARRGTRRAREGTRARIERNASHLRERLTRGVGPGNARRELRVRARARCRSLSETASRLTSPRIPSVPKSIKSPVN